MFQKFGHGILDRFVKFDEERLSVMVIWLKLLTKIIINYFEKRNGTLPNSPEVPDQYKMLSSSSREPTAIRYILDIWCT